MDDCAKIAESGLKPPFESPHLDFPEIIWVHANGGIINGGVACVCAKWCVFVYFCAFLRFFVRFCAFFSYQNGLQKSANWRIIVQKYAKGVFMQDPFSYTPFCMSPRDGHRNRKNRTKIAAISVRPCDSLALWGGPFWLLFPKNRLRFSMAGSFKKRRISQGQRFLEGGGCYRRSLEGA